MPTGRSPSLGIDVGVAGSFASVFLTGNQTSR